MTDEIEERDRLESDLIRWVKSWATMSESSLVEFPGTSSRRLLAVMDALKAAKLRDSSVPPPPTDVHAFLLSACPEPLNHELRLLLPSTNLIMPAELAVEPRALESGSPLPRIPHEREMGRLRDVAGVGAHIPGNEEGPWHALFGLPGIEPIYPPQTPEEEWLNRLIDDPLYVTSFSTEQGRRRFIGAWSYGRGQD
ncbi:MAG: hypothetical protein WA719_03150, partial [Thermoplasmata archaeon]